MGAEVVVRRGGIGRASGGTELWRGLRRRLGEDSLTLQLLLKRPLAAAGLVITLVHVRIAIAASVLPGPDVLLTDVSNPVPQAPRGGGGGQAGSWPGHTY